MASKGYPVPPELPEDSSCLIVFYPKDVGRFFSRALAGQLTRLASTWVWDAEIEYQQQIAYLWAAHNQRTLEAWETLDCELAEWVESGEDMNINVTTSGGGGGGCGCGCGCAQSDNPLNLDNPELPEGTPTIPEDTATETDHSMTAGGLCDLATYLAASYANVFVTWNNNFEVVGSGVTAIINFIQGKMFDGQAPSILTFPAILLANLSAILTTGILASITQRASDAAQQIQDDLICAVAGSDSPVQAKQNFNSVVASTKAIYGTSAYFFLWLVAQFWKWDEVLTPGVITIPAQFVGSTCDCGVNPPADIAGYEWRKAALIQPVQTSPYTSSLVVGNSGYEYQATIPTSATNWDTQVKAIKPLLNAGESIVGFTLMIKDSYTDGGINDPATGHPRLTGLVTSWEGSTPWRNLIVSTGSGGIHQTALSAAAAFDQVDGVSSGTASAERTMTHYARIGVGGSPPGNLGITVSEVYYAVLLP